LLVCIYFYSLAFTLSFPLCYSFSSVFLSSVSSFFSSLILFLSFYSLVCTVQMRTYCGRDKIDLEILKDLRVLSPS
jgi:hypothetical protein